MKNHRPYFRHFVFELECEFDKANSIKWITNMCKRLIKELDITTLKSIKHIFSPQGISLIYIISSSHMSIHTWPENNYIHIDFLTCAKNDKYDNIDYVFKRVFPENNYKITELKY